MQILPALIRCVLAGQETVKQPHPGCQVGTGCQQLQAIEMTFDWAAFLANVRVTAFNKRSTQYTGGRRLKHQRLS